jgi:NAD(P)-dependent dehydrogenase (short-subunit alcohol dehydrogenase family)
MTEASRDQPHGDTVGAIPAGRVGEVEDVAQACLFSFNGSFATGSILTVDGAARADAMPAPRARTVAS